MITRHVLTLPDSGRRVHYRRCGMGPALLMVHQSPRSSAEYGALMERWGKNFTCIAPDTPGFGQSDPLPGNDGRPAEIGDFADALAAFVRAIGLSSPCPAYGFHSGGIILVAAMRRHQNLFRCLAVGGYAIWTAEEMAIFSERYLPPFHPSAYGEHLTWLWNRMLEQSWVFPWFDTRDDARLAFAHADVARVDQAVMEMLDAGDAYRAGYGAVLRAPRDIPPPHAVTPPVLITAYDGDPLQAHINRLGTMPPGWEARKVASPAVHQDESLAFLKEHGGLVPCPALAEDENEGWLAGGEGLTHWKGTRGSRYLSLHDPAGEMNEPAEGEIVIDLPGHGQSDDCDDMTDLLTGVMAHFDLAGMKAPELPRGDPARLYPDMTPDRFGLHLQRAWQVARAEAFFEPWYEVEHAQAITLVQAQLEPAAIHGRCLARLRAGPAARRWHETLVQLSKEGLP